MRNTSSSTNDSFARDEKICTGVDCMRQKIWEDSQKLRVEDCRKNILRLYAEIATISSPQRKLDTLQQIENLRQECMWSMAQRFILHAAAELSHDRSKTRRYVSDAQAALEFANMAPGGMPTVQQAQAYCQRLLEKAGTS